MRRRDEKFPENGFEAWGGYMHAKVSKLKEQFSSKAAAEIRVSNIFNGISIFVNGFTIPSADELKELMVQHGGVYHTYQTNDDFIIASNLPDTKVKNMSLSKVVKPEWITDSIKCNCLLDYNIYLLYSNKRTQPKLNFNRLNKTESTPNFENDNTTVYEESKANAIISDENTNNNQLLDTNHKPNKLQQETKQCNIAKTAVDPNFISEFYNNSRLHHISQLGASFKQYINDLRDESNYLFPARVHLSEKIRFINKQSTYSINFEYNKIIMHIDMDCFFVSVGLRSRSDLKGKPIAVTHSKGGQSQKRPGVDRNVEFNLYKQRQAAKWSKVSETSENNIETRVDNIGDEGDKFGSMSEIASCSYEAREKGVKNGMFMGAALRLCPDLQTIPYDFDGYKEVAYTLYNTIAQYTLDIEAVSCDEMYVDCTTLLKDLNVDVVDFATVLREEIKEKTGCPCSTGFGGNRLQARLATKKAKPNGQFFLTSDLVEDFIFNISLKDLPGVGRQISQKLESLGHYTCGSLQQLTLAHLQKYLGNKIGLQLFNQCRGRDLNSLTFHVVRKSVSAEVNYGIRFENNEQCYNFIKQLSAEVHSRMEQFKVVGKCITLKLMVRAKDAPVETAKFMGHGYCDVINKSVSLTSPTSDPQIIAKEIVLLCMKLNIDPREMRGIGIQITKLESVNNRQTKGSLTKFIVSEKINNKPVKKEDLKSINDMQNSHIAKTNPVTPKKVFQSPNMRSPILSSKRSPTIGPKRSPSRKRGRPPKSLKLEQSTKSVMDKFLQGNSSNTILQAKVSMEKKEIKQETVIETPAKKEKGLLGLHWEQTRELLRAWLDSNQTPKLCDINMISDYMCDMVINKNIDKLYILIKFFRRRVTELNDEIWSEVQNCILEKVQNTMIAVYGKKLWFESN
ncbi:DNA repair protein Rev1 [Leptidea sinapis]|uniref:DNA repair protein Rev1 n=1 Tax=Leptidea sinapis TaxID=189913 RepID=UPI0021C44E0E|nr:DNA repair protein Rev1 [Leptidea sinapis]